MGSREEQCVREMPQMPKAIATLHGPGTYVPTRENTLKALAWYAKVCRYILPVDPLLSKACLWHDDLHAQNIIMDPENPTKVVGILDWQSTSIKPLYQRSSQPAFLDYVGPLLAGVTRPQMPPNIQDMADSEQRQAKLLFYSQLLCCLYRTLLQKQIPVLYAALNFSNDVTQDVLSSIGTVLTEGEPLLLARMLELEDVWADLPTVREQGVPFPLAVTDQERKQIWADCEGALRGMEEMKSIETSLGDLFPEKGFVYHEEYEDAKEGLRLAKKTVIDKYAKTEEERKIWHQNWPFDDEEQAFATSRVVARRPPSLLSNHCGIRRMLKIQWLQTLQMPAARACIPPQGPKRISERASQSPEMVFGLEMPGGQYYIDLYQPECYRNDSTVKGADGAERQRGYSRKLCLTIIKAIPPLGRLCLLYWHSMVHVSLHEFSCDSYLRHYLTLRSTHETFRSSQHQSLLKALADRWGSTFYSRSIYPVHWANTRSSKLGTTGKAAQRTGSCPSGSPSHFLGQVGSCC